MGTDKEEERYRFVVYSALKCVWKKIRSMNIHGMKMSCWDIKKINQNGWKTLKGAFQTVRGCKRGGGGWQLFQQSDSTYDLHDTFWLTCLIITSKVCQYMWSEEETDEYLEMNEFFVPLFQLIIFWSKISSKWECIILMEKKNKIFSCLDYCYHLKVYEMHEER